MYRPTELALSEAEFADYDFDQSHAYSDDISSAPDWAQQTSASQQSLEVVRPVLRNIPGVVTASRLETPPAPTVSSGLAALDALTGGLPRGSLTEICGPASSGRTSLLLTAMAAVTSRGELCALVDVSDCFDPNSAAAAGIDLDRLLWIRCSGMVLTTADSRQEQQSGSATDLFAALHAKQSIGTFMPHAKVWYGRPPARSERAHEHQRMANDKYPGLRNSRSKHMPEHGNAPATSHPKQYWAHRVDQALKATDLLLQGGGFGMVIVDLGDVPADIARRVPLTSWFRFRRAVENTTAVLLAVAQQSCARTCASLVLQLRAAHTMSDPGFAETPSHTRVFKGLNITVEILRSRLDSPAHEKKPPRPVRTTFGSQTQWAG